MKAPVIFDEIWMNRECWIANNLFEMIHLKNEKFEKKNLMAISMNLTNIFMHNK